MDHLVKYNLCYGIHESCLRHKETPQNQQTRTEKETTLNLEILWLITTVFITS